MNIQSINRTNHTYVYTSMSLNIIQISHYGRQLFARMESVAYSQYKMYELCDGLPKAVFRNNANTSYIGNGNVPLSSQAKTLLQTA